jgi:type III pantothenate kinase
MNLVVDVGNTLIKLAIFDKRRLVYKKIGVKSDFDKNIELIFEEFPLVENVVLSVVGAFSEKSRLKLEKKYRVFHITPQIKIPFVNDYATPQTLGVDRIALVSAAIDQYPEKQVLIIDVGTCITYDFLTSEGHYKGGAISPGINMRYRALSEFTDKLPLLDANIPNDIIGNSTQTSIHSGVIYGVTMEIDGVISQYRQDFEDLTVILTGGNAHFLLDRLKNSIFANPNFLLEGLNFLLEYNQNT